MTKTENIHETDGGSVTEALPDPFYNNGLTHEALHTAFVLLETWSQHVLDSRCARHFPDVMEAAKKTAETMHEAYQVIGAHFHEEGSAHGG